MRRAVKRRSNAARHCRRPSCATRACGVDRLVDRVDDEAGRPVLDHLGHRSAAECHHGDAARERFDHHQTERLRPVDREEQRARVAEKLVLVLLADLADVLDQRMVEQRADVALEVGFVGGVDLGRYAQRLPARQRDGDGAIDPFLGEMRPTNAR
jgi:hypothetical protein